MKDPEQYRQEVRETMQAFSDQALAYQDRIIIGGIDREECDREIERRRTAARMSIEIVYVGSAGHLRRYKVVDEQGRYVKDGLFRTEAEAVAFIGARA